MTVVRLLMALVLAGGLLAGCGQEEVGLWEQYDLGTGEEIVRESISQIGGLEAWQDVGRVEADALVTIYDERGGAWYTGQEQVYRLRGGELFGMGGTVSADVQSGQGAWSIRVNERGEGSFQAPGQDVPEAVRNEFKSALGLLLHRVRGPLNLLDPEERVASAETVRLGGQDYVRLGVTGDRAQVIAYYFDVDDGMLRHVTAGSEVPGGEGTVTTYDWKLLSGGMAFPARIRVVEVGENVLVGDEPVLEVDFGTVRMR